MGVNRFLQKVYKTTGLSIFGALGTSYAVLSIPALTAIMTPLAFGGMISTLVGLISTSMMKTQYSKVYEKLNATEKI